MRKILIYGIIIFQILLIVSLVRGIQLSKRSATRIAALQQAKDKLVAERDKLNQQKEEVQSPYYLEKVARDELNLGKEGETTVIIPDNIIQIPEVSKEQGRKHELANWQKWLNILLGQNEYLDARR